MSHHSLRSGKGDIPQRDYRDGGHVNDPVSRQTGNDHAERAKKLTDIKCASFTEPCHDSSGESAGNGRRENAHDGESNANRGLAPRETINRVKRPDDEDFM